MNNNKYWEDRANERMVFYHRNSDKTIAKINKAYDKAIEDINKDIEKIFYKFANDGELTLGEARALLNSTIPKKEWNEIRAKIDNIQDEELRKYLMSQLNAPAYKARITRLEALKESIYINSKTIADTELNESKLGYIDSINEAYYRSIYDIQKGTGLAFEFATMATNTIEEILKNNWSGKHYSKRVWDNTDIIAEKLEEVITSGLMEGKSSRRMAKDLQELTGAGKMAAERLIRTETTYVTNMAEIEAYKECEIDKYIFLATLDLRTSPMCRKLDGKIIEVSKAMTGKNLPPLHPWCRSTTRGCLGNMERLQRRARDPETGGTYIIDGNINYEEWYQKYVVDKYGTKKTEIFEKMIKNKSHDRNQYKEVATILGKDAPKSFDKFQDLKYNNPKEWELTKDYIKSRANNMISALTPFSQYKEYKEIINNEVIGLTTTNGIKITCQSKHFIERVFGTTLDPGTNRPRSGVAIEDIKDAVLNGTIRIRKNDLDSIKLITDRCIVSINPNTGNLIQVNPQ